MVFSETDWKYFRRVQAEMLSTLCTRINQEAQDILQSPAESEHARYLRLRRHIKDSDKIVAECFNDWRRSRMAVFLANLSHHGLLTEEHLAHLDPETQEFVKRRSWE